MRTDRPRLWLFRPDKPKRGDYRSVLRKVFQVSVWQAPADAFQSRLGGTPFALVIDQDIGDADCKRLEQFIANDVIISRCPVVLMTSAHLGPPVTQDTMAWVAKPIDADQVLATTLDMANARIELGWRRRDQQLARALREIVQAFRSLRAALTASKTGEETPSLETYRDTAMSINAVLKAGRLGELIATLQWHFDDNLVHSTRVGALLGGFGLTMGLDDRRTEELILAGLIHDLGKYHVPETVLRKTDALTEGEMDMMRGHVGGTTAFLSRCVDVPKAVRIVAEQHHERMDGTGYPHGLSGEDVNTLARMAAIADVYCAMTDHRAHREPLSAEDAMARMERMDGTLDTGLLKMFGVIIRDLPRHSMAIKPPWHEAAIRGH